jgi:hypothetical protein
MTRDVGFPWKSVIAASAVGFTAGAIALLSVLTLLSYMENDVLTEFNGHIVGGASDKAVATAVAVFFGAVAVFALLTCRRWA